MSKDFLKLKVGSNRFCHALLFVYITALTLIYSILYFKGSAFVALSVDTSDIDDFINIFEISAFSIDSILFKNIVHSVLHFFSRDYYFSFAWTSFFFYILSVILVYCIANHNKKNSYCGLLAVFVFTTAFDMFMPVFAANVHVMEMFFLLSVFYLYALSDNGQRLSYYFLFLFVYFMGFFERGSIVLHFAIMIFILFLETASSKKYRVVLYHIPLILIMFLFFFTNKNGVYLINKLGYWRIVFDQGTLFDLISVPYYLLLNFMQQIDKKLSSFYLLWFAAFFLRVYFYRIKTHFSIQNIVFIHSSLVMFLYYFTLAPVSSDFMDGFFYGQGARIDDILPVFPLVAIAFADYFYRINIFELKKFVRCAAVVLLVLFVVRPSADADSFQDLLINEEKLKNEKKFSTTVSKFGDTVDFLSKYGTTENLVFVVKQIKKPKQDIIRNNQNRFLEYMNDYYQDFAGIGARTTLVDDFFYNITWLMSIYGSSQYSFLETDLLFAAGDSFLENADFVKVLYCTKDSADSYINVSSDDLKYINSWEIKDAGGLFYFYVFFVE
nr:hypothetical protein 25 [bacterium]